MSTTSSGLARGLLLFSWTRNVESDSDTVYSDWEKEMVTPAQGNEGMSVQRLLVQINVGDDYILATIGVIIHS